MLAKLKLLLIDDNVEFLESMQRALRDFHLLTASGAAEARPLIYDDLDLVLLDLRLNEEDDSDRESLSLLKLIKSERPLLPVMIITAYRDFHSVVECLNAGADYFLQKGWELADLRHSITETIRKAQTLRKIEYFTSELKSFRPPPTLVGNHPGLREIRDLIPVIAEKDMPVLISGSPGTGKETVARMIHAHSPRSFIPFIGFNCDRTDKSVNETRRELFGYVEEVHQRFIPGACERGHRGIVFLRALDKLHTTLQLEILTVMNQGIVHPIGQTPVRRVDVRIIAGAARENAILPDVYHRFHTRLALPTLSERPEDIPDLIAFLMNQLQQQDGRPLSISETALHYLQSYPWPYQNIRELKDALAYSRSECREDQILPEHLPIKIRDPFSSFMGNGGPPIPDAGMDFKKQVGRYQLYLVNKALRQTGGRKIEAAHLLRFNSRHTFKRMVEGLIGQYQDLQNDFPMVKTLYAGQDEISGD